MNRNFLRKLPFSSLPWLTSLIAILLVVPVLSYFLWKRNPQLIDENDVLEFAQAVFLLLASVMHAERAFRQKTNSALVFIIHAGLGLLTFSFALREIEIDWLGSSEVWGPIENAIRIAGVAL